jgi:hypothetical protein
MDNGVQRNLSFTFEKAEQRDWLCFSFWEEIGLVSLLQIAESDDRGLFTQFGKNRPSNIFCSEAREKLAGVSSAWMRTRLACEAESSPDGCGTVCDGLPDRVWHA